jgi:hypothetical protein
MGNGSRPSKNKSPTFLLPTPTPLLSTGLEYLYCSLVLQVSLIIIVLTVIPESTSIKGTFVLDNNVQSTEVYHQIETLDNLYLLVLSL